MPVNSNLLNSGMVTPDLPVDTALFYYESDHSPSSRVVWYGSFGDGSLKRGLTVLVATDARV